MTVSTDEDGFLRAKRGFEKYHLRRDYRKVKKERNLPFEPIVPAGPEAKENIRWHIWPIAIVLLGLLALGLGLFLRGQAASPKDYDRNGLTFRYPPGFKVEEFTGLGGITGKAASGTVIALDQTGQDPDGFAVAWHPDSRDLQLTDVVQRILKSQGLRGFEHRINLAIDTIPVDGVEADYVEMTLEGGKAAPGEKRLIRAAVWTGPKSEARLAVYMTPEPANREQDPTLERWLAFVRSIKITL